MRFTIEWLKDHIDTASPLDDIVQTLIRIGFEVESVIDPTKNLNGFVTGQILDIEKHPHADRLNLCTVAYGPEQTIQVVCGASNVKKGLRIIFAPLHTVIPNSGITLKKTMIRNVESCGMICSAEELELQDLFSVTDGIIELQPTKFQVGEPLLDFLKREFHFEASPVIDISITPNRGDVFSVRGIARELAAAGLGGLKPLEDYTLVLNDDNPIDVTLQSSSGCPYFTTLCVKEANNVQSPSWISNRLKAIGTNPHSLFVDVTNYIQFDLGRPMHVFDKHKLRSHTLTVRKSSDNEPFQALNEKLYTLNDGMTVIDDGKGIISLAGIMGGLESACTLSTKDVLLESAYFYPMNIAQSGQTLSILSDSRTRFERGVDPELVDYALTKAAFLIQKYGGGTLSQMKKSGTKPILHQTILFSIGLIEQVCGMSIPAGDIKNILEKLGCKVAEDSKGILKVETPTWRHDLKEPIDLVEEIIRLYGYEHLPSSELKYNPVVPYPIDSSNLLVAKGYYQTVSFSFISNKYLELFGYKESDLKPLEIDNPVSSDLNVMRPSIIPSLLKIVEHNLARQQQNLSFFEKGPTWGIDLQQRNMIAGLRMGGNHDRHWLDQPRSYDVFDIKSDLLSVLNLYGLNSASLQSNQNQSFPYYHPGRSAVVTLGKTILGYMGEIHPQVLYALGIDNRICCFEIFLDNLPPLKARKINYQIPLYPAVLRDFGFIIDKAIAAGDVVRIIEKANPAITESVTIFDVFEGKNIPEGKKSIAIQVKFQPYDVTLNDEKIQEYSQNIINQVQKITGGVLRDGS